MTPCQENSFCKSSWMSFIGYHLPIFNSNSSNGTNNCNGIVLCTIYRRIFEHVVLLSITKE